MVFDGSIISFADRLITIINGKTAESDGDIPMNEATFKLLSDLCERRKSEFVFRALVKSASGFSIQSGVHESRSTSRNNACAIHSLVVLCGPESISLQFNTC